MARRDSKTSLRMRRTPAVRIARPKGRPYQLRYFCPKLRKEVRISTGTRDEEEAASKKQELEAKLLLGIETRRRRSVVLGPEMEWDEFRERYRTDHLATVRDSTATHAESRLDLAERIMKPQSLGDLAQPNSLQQLQAKLYAGSESRRGMPRSHHTVRGYMNTVLAAMNWAHLQGWLPTAPKLRKLKTSKQKTMKGRPLTQAEFSRMLDCTATIVGEEAADSWRYLQRGLWESALRLDELMHLSWDLHGTIRPVWPKGEHPVLLIPAPMQKNDTDESIPMLPWLEAVLCETPLENRTGWVFNPRSLQLRIGRKPRHHRPNSEWVGKIITRIGAEAKVVVEQADERTGRPVKHATAHDLRRSCGERLREAGVPPLVICRVMRHASWETTRKYYAPGDIQHDANVLRSILTFSPANRSDTHRPDAPEGKK